MRLLEEEPEAYDLILMDLQMPEMDGLEACRHIRGQLRQTALPIIALTANTADMDEKRCRAAGMNDFLSKPIDAAELGAKLARWLPAEKTGRALPQGDQNPASEFVGLPSKW